MGSKRLYRSAHNRIFSGVCGGLGEYMNVDPVVIRLVWAIFSCMSLGTGVLFYIAAIFIMPDGSAMPAEYVTRNAGAGERENMQQRVGYSPEIEKRTRSVGGVILTVLGGIFILAGVAGVIRVILSWLFLGSFWTASYWGPRFEHFFFDGVIGALIAIFCFIIGCLLLILGRRK